MSSTAVAMPTIMHRSRFCSNSRPAIPVYGTMDGLGVEIVPLAVAPGMPPVPVPVPVAPIGPTALLLPVPTG